MAKKEESLIVAEQYSVLTLEPKELQSVIKDNLGQDRLEITDLDIVKMPSGGSIAWMIPSMDGEQPAKTFSGIIVHWKNQRVYWKAAYSGAQNPPDCFSADGLHGVGVPGGDCELCPLSKFGTAENGNGQACRQNRLLFVLQPESFLPLVLRLSPASISASKKYFVGLAARSTAYYDVVTTFGLEKDKSGGGIDYSKATFKIERRLDKEEILRVRNYQQAIRPILDRTTILDVE